MSRRLLYYPVGQFPRDSVTYLGASSESTGSIFATTQTRQEEVEEVVQARQEEVVVS